MPTRRRWAGSARSAAIACARSASSISARPARSPSSTADYGVDAQAIIAAAEAIAPGVRSLFGRGGQISFRSLRESAGCAWYTLTGHTGRGVDAQHITFGDPDFFNGVGHSMQIVEALHREHPGLSYDVTIKVEHLLKHAGHLPALRETGCAFVTTAVESVDDHVLRILDKGHTRADFIRLAGLMRGLGLFLVPTFVPFTPWTTLEGYEDLLATLIRLGLVEHVPPVQLTIRLLIPAGSRLLEVLPLHNAAIAPFQQEALSYPWANPDRKVDRLQCDLEAMVQRDAKAGASRTVIVGEAWKLLQRAMNEDGDEAPAPLPLVPPGPPRATIPYLTEPWYC